MSCEHNIYVGYVNESMYGVKKCTKEEVEFKLKSPTDISISLGEDSYIFIRDVLYSKEHSDVLTKRILEVHKQMLLKNEFSKIISSK